MQVWFEIGDVFTATRGKVKYYGRVLRCRIDKRLDCNVWDPTIKKFAIKAFAKEEMRHASEVEREILRQRSVIFNKEVGRKFNGKMFLRQDE